MVTDFSQWLGIAKLDYQKKDSKTLVTSAYSQAPFKIQRPFYPEGEGICHSVLLHTAGGMVEGDRLSQTINLQKNAHSLITTTAASKIYRSQGQVAQQDITIKIDSGACLEYLPQETIIFNGAIYQQNLKVELAPDATWLNWEITRFGRTARGEKFIQGDWRSLTEIWQNEQLLWCDRQWLPGNPEIEASLNGLAGYPIFATLTWIGKPVNPEIIAQMRQLWEQKPTQGQTGITQMNQILLCRYRGNSTQEVKTWFFQIWQLLRQHYLGINAIKSRFWQL
jgi:urease accessory protein